MRKAKRETLLEQIAIDRLASLGCEKLPPLVRETIVGNFFAEVESKAAKLAGRMITLPKIAQAFVSAHPLAADKERGGGSGGGEALPPDEVGFGDQSHNH